MDLSAGSGELAFALKDLRARWQEVKSQWSDPVRDDFEEHHLNPLEAQVMATLTAINSLGHLFLKAQQECD